MDPIAEFAKEWPIIKQVWLTMLVVSAGLGVLMFFAFNWRYGGRIESLNERLANRDERIADYERKLSGASPDEAKARLEALEASIHELRGRHLTDEQIQIMLAALSGHTGSIFASYQSSSVDGLSFSAAIRSVFESAGWKVALVQQISDAGWAQEGLEIRIPGDDPLTPRDVAVTSAFDRAGLLVRVTRRSAPRPGYDVELLVSARTAPLSGPPPRWG